MYQVKLEKFEGPMELLLELIEKEKMDITELSLSKVADEYLEFIRDNEKISLEHLAEFLSVASRLILIKSRALLPTLKFSDEEEAEIHHLEKQLEEYKKFKDASANLDKLFRSRRMSFSRQGFENVAPIFYPPENINIYDLKKYFSEVLSEIPLFEKLKEEIVAEVVTLEEKINDLEQKLRQKIDSSFSELVSGAKDKIDVIITFLAMLEMVKQKVVAVEQNKLFDEIKLNIKTT